MKPHLHVVQVRSTIGQSHAMSLTLKGLGLRGPNSEVFVKNTPSFRGAVKKVMHLVTVEEVDTVPAKKAAAGKTTTAKPSTK
jgi:large subunit ribosomal protein L30